MTKRLRFSLVSWCYLQTAVMAAAVWVLNRSFFTDDAYISLRYARNLLSGMGMIWQEGERVEGYTNFLFIILTAALGWLGIDLVVAARIISFAGFFGVLAVIAWYTGLLPAMRRARLSPHEKLCAAMAFAIVGSSGPLLVWCMGGLEGTLFAFFTTLGVCLTLQWLRGQQNAKTAAILGVSFALATLTRPEGLMLFGFTFAWLAGLFLLPSHRHLAKPRHLLILLAAYAAIWIPYTAWRVSYFGEWMPNTYYVKIYGIPAALKLKTGAFYVLQYFVLPPLLPLFAFGLAGIAAGKKAMNAALWYLLLFSLLLLAYIVHVGGDFMEHFRFMIPLVPALALLIYHCGLLLPPKLWRDGCLGLLFFLAFQIGLVEQKYPTPGAVFGRSVSAYVQSHWPEGSLVALNQIGALPYMAPRYRYIDMLGLLDKTIARRTIDGWHAHFGMNMGHAKGDGAYVLSRKPDYIMFGDSRINGDPIFSGDIEIAESPEFRKRYRKVVAYVTPPASLLPALRRDIGASKPSSGGDALTDENQVRFVYYQRKK